MTPLTAVPAPGPRFNLAQHLLGLNISRPNKAAFIDDHGALSYAQLAERVQRLAAGLLDLGVRREERVLLLMHDGCDWPVSFLGALHAGIVPVAINTLLTAEDYAYMLQNSRAQAVLVSAALLPVLQAALTLAAKDGGHEVRHLIVSRPTGPSPTGPSPTRASVTSASVTPASATPEPGASASTGAPAEHALDALIARYSPQTQAANTAPDDPGFWLYSSGSTGRPKGALHSHANAYWTAELYGKRLLGLTETDVCFSAAKLYFAYGLGNGLSFPMSVGATTILMAERPTPEATFKRWRGGIGGVKPTVFFGAPTGFAGMLASPALPARSEVALRLASSAGEALPAELGERFGAHYGIEIIDGIGSTEMLHVFLSNAPGRVRYGSTGWPVPGYEIELRGEDGLPVPDGEIGDLYISGPSAALMYWGNREKSRDTFQGAWTKSGDKYVRNADGSCTYAGRSDDMLKVSGIYVSPFEVESTLMQHAAVLEAAVIGVSDADGLTKTKAFVVLKAGQTASEAELKAFVKDRLAAYKYPRQIAFIAELPKTATGKIQRFKLRDQERGV